MFTLLKVVGERARSPTTFVMITNQKCQLYPLLFRKSRLHSAFVLLQIYEIFTRILKSSYEVLFRILPITYSICLTYLCPIVIWKNTEQNSLITHGLIVSYIVRQGFVAHLYTFIFQELFKIATSYLHISLSHLIHNCLHNDFLLSLLG